MCVCACVRLSLGIRFRQLQICTHANMFAVYGVSAWCRKLFATLPLESSDRNDKCRSNEKVIPACVRVRACDSHCIIRLSTSRFWHQGLQWFQNCYYHIGSVWVCVSERLYCHNGDSLFIYTVFSNLLGDTILVDDLDSANGYRKGVSVCVCACMWITSTFKCHITTTIRS